MIQNTFKRVRDQRVRRTTFAEQKPEEMNGIRQQKQAWEQQQQTQDNQISTPLGFDRSITMRPTSQASGVTDQDSDDDK